MPDPLSLADADLRIGNASTVDGLDDERSVAWSDLAALPRSPLVRTLCCVGNGKPFDRTFGWRFGGISNGSWDVVALSGALAHLGLQPRSPSDHLRVEARDSWRRNFTAERVSSGSLFLAFALNGAPLPHAHGGPARLLSTGDYGEMNVKWIHSLTWGPPLPEEDGEEGQFTTDLPASPMAFATMPLWGARPAAGVLELAGIAYAGRNRVARVLVARDGGPPEEAELLDAPEPGFWRRWQHRVQLTPGHHQLATTCVDDQGRASEFMRPEDGYPSRGARPVHELELAAV